MTFPLRWSGTDPGRRPAATQELDKLLHMAAAGLSVLVLVAGFFSFAPAASAYAVGLGWIPALYLIAGGLSAQVLLPGKPAKPGCCPASSPSRSRCRCCSRCSPPARRRSAPTWS